MYICFSLQARW